jgi:hypothetical protein
MRKLKQKPIEDGEGASARELNTEYTLHKEVWKRTNEEIAYGNRSQ